MVSNTPWTQVWEAKAGNQDALELLCVKYRAPVIAYLRKRGLTDEAEDVAQEALVALLGALEGIDPNAGRFRALVISITRNKLLHHHRRHLAQKRGGGKVTRLERPGELAKDEADEVFDREWLGAILERTLEQLQETQPLLHQALVSIAIAERSYAEVSAELGVSAGALRKRVMRGRRHLAELLEQEVWFYGHSVEDVDAEVAHLTKLLGPFLTRA